MKEILSEIKFQMETLTRYLRELKLKLLGINRSFNCQSDIEFERKCKNQCEHCKEYYKFLED